MDERVAIVAAAQTKYGDMRKYNPEELAYMAIRQVLRQTGLTFGPAYERGGYVDADVVCHEHFYFEKPFSASLVLDASGGNMRPEEKVDGDGALGVVEAACQILSGDFETVLVVAECHENLAWRSFTETQVFDPFFLRPMGLDELTSSALQANRYLKKHRIGRERLAEVVVKSRKYAADNPFAVLSGGISVEEVLGSPMLSYPLTEYDVRPSCDGACAMILASEGRAGELTDTPVWITGIGRCLDGYFIGDRDLADVECLRKAAARAYGMAGISDPSSHIDVFEVSDHFSYQELMWCEGLGLCGPGEGADLLESGATAREGPTPVNPSGGALSGCPHTVVGMARVAEIALQLKGEAGGRQIAGAGRGLAHSVSGPCGQFHQVLILESN
jgi:acetyl-CoA C-acetyltransferase